MKKDYRKEWAQNNPEKVNQSQKKWRNKNSDKVGYSKMLNAAKNLISPKADSASEQHILWKIKNDRSGYLSDLETLRFQIDKKIMELK